MLSLSPYLSRRRQEETQFKYALARDYRDTNVFCGERELD